ncbi:hypothetical protein IEN85_03255 [Pelagicoccus sp. NFK12]|uniref:Cohesin domain-containing protein n=1 Tax=Pelagicoccus enzymogenes TaxID=2773457 RepID=A0A927F6C4_9BACT|nr:hypothetical protein [Pelagicoccus enzymogenes]MBD5778496.1 hypothetical protein [Pelagicoccus enzymogenes]
MNIKDITRMGSLVMVGVAALACASSSKAVSYNFEVLDSSIRVGESFDVAFVATFDSVLEVATFAFDLDPLGFLPANGIIQLNDWSVPLPLSKFSFGPSEVGALGDPFDPLFGGTDILLATLSFTALSAGTESVAVVGPAAIGQGLELYDFDSDTSEFFDIESNFEVTVNAVPDSSVYAALPMILIGMAAFRRKIA